MQKKDENMLNIQSKLFKRVIIIVIALFSGFILGTIYKTPNYYVILESKRQDTKWKSEKLIEFYRTTSPLFSFKSFEFNLVAGAGTFLLVLFLGFFMADEPFRYYLFKKIFFIEEKRKHNE